MRLNKSWKNRLSKLFNQRNKKKITLFLFHDPPIDTTLDLVNNPQSPLDGKHVGDQIIRDFIERYKPDLSICGHMHETQGYDKVGKSLVINAGYGRVGEYLILEIKDNKIKYNLKK